jgi:TPP-dependent 2-oxoacid decarboxylase
MSDLNQNIAGYLIQRLYDSGVRHISGVPGDFVLGFYKELIESNKLKVINTCDEQGAAFAADSYARINGLGAVCLTYCVGGLIITTSLLLQVSKRYFRYVIRQKLERCPYIPIPRYILD